MATQVIMPQLGESVVEGTVGSWLVAEGQPVKQYDPLLAITTDKVDTEVSAPASGILLKIYVPEGQTVAHGTVLGLIGAQGEVAPEQPTQAGPGGHGHAAAATDSSGQPAIQATPVAQRVAQEHGVDLAAVTGSGPGGRITKEDVEAHLAGAAPAATSGGTGEKPASPTGVPGGRPSLGFISPAVARLAAEHNVDLSRVTGTGEGGRITKKDLLAYVEAGPRGEVKVAAAAELPPWEQPGSGSLFKPSEEQGAAEPAGSAALPPMPTPMAAAPAATTAADGDEVRPLSVIRRSIARHMVLSKHTAPHVTTVMEADLTPVVQAREQLKEAYERQGARLTFTPFFVQAIVAGLKAVPEANSTFQDDSLLLHRHINIGMAVAISDGLIVPVIRDADDKSLLGLARAVNDLAERARTRRLSPDEVQGGTFTLTNHGTAGSLLATPIINQPQAGILGIGAIQKRPIVISRGASLLPGPDDFIAIRPMAYLSFTFDHRVLDGAGADGFLAAVKQFLENYRL